LRELQERMEGLGLELVVYGSCQNFQYLTGTLVDWRRGRDLTHPEDNVFVPREGDPIATLSEASSGHAKETWIEDVRVHEGDGKYGETLERVLSDLGVEAGDVGLGEHLWGPTVLDVARAVRGSKFRDASTLMDHLRMIKEPEEVERLRRAAELTDGVMEEVVQNVREGVTQGELSLDIEMVGRRTGASDVSFPPTAGFVKSGSEPSEDPFTYPREEGLVEGTSVAFDVGFVLDGYCSDWGRSLYFGPADEGVRNGYEALQQAVVETVDRMHEGSMKVSDVFPSIEAVLDRLGYGDYLRARLPTGTVGHQIGVEVHEPPWLKPGQGQELREGMVMCLEPKLWHNGEYYLRVEDMVLVKKDRAEFLTNFDRQL